MESQEMMAKASDPEAGPLFGELLVEKGLLRREELDDVLRAQREGGGRLGEVLLTPQEGH